MARVRDGKRSAARTRVAARVLIVVGAVLSALWLGGNLRALDRENDAVVAMGRAIGNGAKPADLARADRDFARARRFAPDAPVRLKEAGVLVGASPRRSAALLHRVLSDEPDNVEGWLIAYALSNGRGDPRRARARRRVLALDPHARRKLDAFDAQR